MAVRDWLETDARPADLYELLGRPRFDPHREELSAAVRAAYAELLDYQNHADPAIVRRAVQLQMELGRAADVLSSPAKLQAHCDSILDRLRLEYERAKGAGPPWSPARLRTWLSAGQSVYPERLDTTVQSLLLPRESPKDQTQAFVLSEMPKRDWGSGPGAQQLDDVGQSTVDPFRVFEVETARGQSEADVPRKRPDAPPAQPPAVAQPAPLPDWVRFPARPRQPKPQPAAASSSGAVRAALAPVRGTDRLLKALAGRRNPVLHNCLRGAAVLLVVAVAVGVTYIVARRQTAAEKDATVAAGQSGQTADADPRSSANPKGPSRPKQSAAGDDAAPKSGGAGRANSDVEKPGPVPKPRRKTGKPTRGLLGQATLAGHASAIRSLAFSPNSATLVSAGDDRTIKLWEVSNGRLVRTIPVDAPVLGLALSPDASTLAGFTHAPADRNVTLWRVASESPPRRLRGHTSALESLAFSPDRSTLAAGAADGTVILWNWTTGEARRTLDRHRARVIAVAFLADGSTLASVDAGGTLRHWRVANGDLQTEVRLPHQEQEQIAHVAFSPSRSVLVVEDTAGAVTLCDAHTGRQRQEPITAPLEKLTCAALSPDGSILAAGGSESKSVSRFHLGFNIFLFPLAGHKERINWLAFSPDGATLASGSEDGELLLWNVGQSKP